MQGPGGPPYRTFQSLSSRSCSFCGMPFSFSSRMLIGLELLVRPSGLPGAVHQDSGQKLVRLELLFGSDVHFSTLQKKRLRFFHRLVDS